MKSVYFFSFIAAFFMSFSQAAPEGVLSGWSDNASKQRIIQFLNRTVDPKASEFLPVRDRVAVFDVDGTLWVEKPRYAQQDFVLSQSSKARSFSGSKSDDANLLNLSAKLFEGMSVRTYQNKSREFLVKDSLHPRYKVPHSQLVYQPMIELIGLLREYEFDVYLCTGSDEGFVRSVANELFGIPADHVIAQNVTYYRDKDNKVLVRGGEYRVPINLAAGKVSNISHRINKKPAFAVGNSLGDLQMLDWVADGGLSVLIVHDDAEREYDYGKKNKKIHKAFSGVNLISVSMKKDFKNIFAEKM